MSAYNNNLLNLDKIDVGRLNIVNIADNMSTNRPVNICNLWNVITTHFSVAYF